MDFNLIIETTPIMFVNWFHNNFRNVPNKLKEISYEDENGNQVKLKLLSPKISRPNSEPVTIYCGAKILIFNTVTNEFEYFKYDFYLQQIKILSLDNKRIQVICLGKSPISVYLTPLIDDIFQAITRTWKDFELTNPQEPTLLEKSDYSIENNPEKENNVRTDEISSIISEKQKKIEKACLEWVNRNEYSFSRLTMDEFLSDYYKNNSVYLSKSEFKRALQKACKRGLIEKGEKGRYSPVKK